MPRNWYQIKPTRGEKEERAYFLVVTSVTRLRDEFYVKKKNEFYGKDKNPADN